MTQTPAGQGSDHSSDLSSFSIERAIERVENLRSALSWFAVQLSKDSAYAAAFQTFAQCLSARRHTILLDRTPLTLDPTAPPEHTQVTPAAQKSQALTARTGITRAQPGIAQVHFCAIGKSGDVSKLIVSMLTSVGVRASFLHPTEALHGDLGSVLPGDAAILISNKGESAELLQLVPLLKKRQATCMAITSQSQSPLARASAAVLTIPHVREFCAYDHAPVTSTVVTLALGQLLVAATMDDGRLDLETYAHNHPGGAIGKRIFLRVSDIMTQGADLPVLQPAASFQECVSVMTERALGVVLVVEGIRLAGIVTEKDLRQAMEKHGPAIFSLRASDIMNPDPISITDDLLAVEALALMENRARPLNVLPVCGEGRSALGLLRLHDLIKAGVTL